MIRQTPGGAIISVHVVPGSKEFSIAGEEEWTGDMKIKIKNKATEGKANQELIEMLEKALSAKVKIISGHKSRRKKILVAADIDTVKKLMK